MLFPTLEFAVFLAVVLPVSWLLRPSWFAWRWFMLGASFFFYGWWDERFVVLLAGSILANHYLGDWVEAAKDDDGRPTDRSRLLVRVGVVGNLGVLGWFKYYGFFTTSLVDSLAEVGIGVDPPLLEVLLPVGISFFTFQAMSYVIDIGRGVIHPMAFLDFAVYLAFFPQLVAGPIVRASEMAPQLATVPDPRRIPSTEAFRLIMQGLFKKVVVASYLADAIVDPVFAVPAERSALEVIIGTYAYAVQIYADFSGYTDIAIGVALLLGFRFPQNFDAPYRATSLQDFWRRWHMTLSRWLRDYLYIPLGGNRGGRLLTYRNLFLTMALGGLWHGAAWTFVVWGVLHGTWLALERFAGEERIAQRLGIEVPAPFGAVLGWIVTFHVVCVAWVFFRADSFGTATELLGRLDDWGPAPLVSFGVVAVTAAMLVSQFVPADAVRLAEIRFSRLTWLGQAAALGAGLVVIDTLGPEGVAPFIYFQF